MRNQNLRTILLRQGYGGQGEVIEMKKVLIVALMLWGIMFFPGCKNFFGPSDPPDTKYSDIVEFMYKRTKPIVDKNSTDPMGFTIWNANGGRATGKLTYLGNDQWMAAISLPYDKEYPYWVFTVDPKVTGVWETVAETFYARIQGASEWRELTCVEVEPYSVKGLAAKFFLTGGVIIIP